MTGAPQISLVIPTLDRTALLARVLARLADQPGAAGAFEVIVAADAAHRDTEHLHRLTDRRPYPVRVVSPERPGASAARNAGWRAAAAGLVLFLDDDVLPEPGLVAAHLDWHRRWPAREIGVLGNVRWARELAVTPFMRWLEHGIQFNYPSIRGDETVWGNFYTANVSVKRALVESVGGFDEARLPFGYEDLDLALRMHRSAGFRLLYHRGARAEHVHPMDVDFWRRRVRRIALAERQFVALHPDFPPYFHNLFSDAAAHPAASRRGTRLIAAVPRRIPVLGERAWRRADLFYRQALAGPFLDAWASSGP